MSSAATITPATTTSAEQPRRRQIFWRFVWKEIHMLRGFWLGLVLLALLVQGAQRMFLPFDQIAASLFATAIAATVLFTAGAAATIFAVEREEQTYDFLRSVPARWRPIYTAKLATIALGALSLALVLSIVSLLVSRGFHQANSSQV